MGMGGLLVLSWKEYGAWAALALLAADCWCGALHWSACLKPQCPFLPGNAWTGALGQQGRGQGGFISQADALCLAEPVAAGSGAQDSWGQSLALPLNSLWP